MFLPTPVTTQGLTAWFIIWLLTLVLYIGRRNKPVIQARSLLLTLTQTIATAISVFFIMAAYFKSQTIPCFLTMWILNLSISVWTLSIFVRILYLYINHRYNQNLLFTHSSDFERPGTSSNALIDEFGYPMDANTTNNKVAPSDYSKESQKRFDILPEMSRGLGLKQSFIRETDKWVAKKAALFRLMRYAIFTYILIIFVYCAIIQGLSPRVSIYPLVQDCYFDLQQYGLCIFSVLIIFIFGGIFATWLVHDIQDHSFIAKELIITYSIGAPMAVLYLLFHTIPFLGTLSFDSNWLIISSLMTSHMTSIVVPIILTYVEDYKASRVTIDLNLKSFQEALGDRLLFEDIKKFAIRDMCGENFYFLEAMRDLKQEAALLVLRQKTRSVTAADYGAMHERMMSVSLTVLRSGNRASHFGQIRKLSLSKDSPAGVIREEASSISETNEVKIRVDVCEEKEEEEEEEGSENNNANVRTVEDSFGINGRPARRSISSETRASILSANDYLKPRESSIGVRVPFLQKESPTEEEWTVINARPVPPDLIPKYNQFFYLYCKRGAPMEVNLSGDVRILLEQVAETSEWKIGDFDAARHEVMNVLFTNVYCRWAFQKKETQTKK